MSNFSMALQTALLLLFFKFTDLLIFGILEKSVKNGGF